MTVIGPFSVDDFGGCVARTDETGQLALVRLIGSLNAGFASLADDVEKSADRTGDAQVGARHASGRTRVLRLVAPELNGEHVELAVAVLQVEIARHGRRLEQCFYLVHFSEQQFTRRRCPVSFGNGARLALVMACVSQVKFNW